MFIANGKTHGHGFVTFINMNSNELTIYKF